MNKSLPTLGIVTNIVTRGVGGRALKNVGLPVYASKISCETPRIRDKFLRQKGGKIQFLKEKQKICSIKLVSEL